MKYKPRMLAYGALATGLLLGSAYLKHLTDAPVISPPSFQLDKAAVAKLQADAMRTPPARMPPAPPSAWIEREKTAFLALAQGSPVSLFIAPVQVHGKGIDRSTRALIGATLTASMVGNYGQQCLNAELVQRALGDGLRTIDPAAIARMASASGALTSLSIEAGHDGHGMLEITMHWSQRATSNASWSLAKTHTMRLPMGLDETVGELFRAKALPEIVGKLGLSEVAQRPGATASGWTRLPATVTEAISETTANPLNEARLYQLLGVLAAERAAQVGERLFAHALVTLAPLDDARPGARLMRARATFYLHARPAALRILGRPGTATERAFLAYMNGNLPAMETEVAAVSDEIDRLILEMELLNLREHYSVGNPATKARYVQTALRNYPQWQVLFERRLFEWDGWKLTGNAPLAALLARAFPPPVAAKSDANPGATQPFEIGALDQVALARAALPAVRDCHPGLSTCAAPAMLDLIEAGLVSNATNALIAAGRVRGDYEGGQRIGAALRPALDGNPMYALAMATIIRALPQDLPAASKATLQAQRKIYVNQAMFWEQGASELARSAYHARDLDRDRRTFADYMTIYGEDLPPHPSWPDPNDYRSFRSPQEAEQQSAGLAQRRRDLLPYAHTELVIANVLATVFAKTDGERADLARAVAGRFVGHPDYPQFALALTTASRSPARRVAAYKEAIRQRPDLFGNYDDYAQYLIETDGAYKAALAIYLTYPGFAPGSDANQVGVSNDADTAGNRLFQQGAFEEAKVMDKIAAELDTGSGGSMHGAIRLPLANRDFAQAAAGSDAMAERYGNAFAYADSLSWRFVGGDPAQAWAGFGQLQDRFKEPLVWNAALIGQHIEKWDWARSKQWLLSAPIRKSLAGMNNAAMRQAILQNSIDRMPATDLTSTLQALEGKPAGDYKGPDSFWFLTADKHLLEIPVSPFKARDPARKPGPTGSQLVMFGDAYTSLRKREDKVAIEKFLELESLYPMTLGGVRQFRFALPYLAWASARTGDTLHLEAFLDARNKDQPDDFDSALAKAILKGVRGDAKAALVKLKLAINRRPDTGNEPIFASYQWTETCEWLFEATGNAQYRLLALNWAKAEQTMHPMLSWPYAIEAKLGMLPAERFRALAMTLYLDPLSERAAGLPAEDKQKAVKAFDASAYFKLKRSTPTQPRASATKA